MTARKRDKQIVFRTSRELELKFKLALQARNETMQQIFENCMIEYINRNKNTIQKYVAELQSISSVED